MPVLCEEAKVAYISVPKCACSSLKLFFHQIRTGVSWQETKQETKRTTGEEPKIHETYPSVPASEMDWDALAGYRIVTAIRGPLPRILSCYNNKIVKEGALETPRAQASLAEAGLTTTPDIATFAAHLDAYRAASPEVERHARPLSHWLGTDPAIFDRIFHVKRLDEVEDWMRQQVGEVPSMRHTNRTRSGVRAKHLTAETRNIIRDEFAEDFDIFDNWVRARND